jgi:uncharacterized membrane protein YiaA
MAPKLSHHKLLLVVGISNSARRASNHSTFGVALVIALYSSYVYERDKVACLQALE